MRFRDSSQREPSPNGAGKGEAPAKPQVFVVFSPESEHAAKGGRFGSDAFVKRLAEHLGPVDSEGRPRGCPPSLRETREDGEAPRPGAACSEEKRSDCAVGVTLQTKYYSAEIEVRAATAGGPSASLPALLSRTLPEAVVFVVGEEEGAPLDLGVQAAVGDEQEAALKPLEIMLQPPVLSPSGERSKDLADADADAWWLRAVPLKYCVWMRSGRDAACSVQDGAGRPRQLTSFVRVFSKDVFVECLELCCCDVCSKPSGGSSDYAATGGAGGAGGMEVFEALAESLRAHLWPGLKKVSPPKAAPTNASPPTGDCDSPVRQQKTTAPSEEPVLKEKDLEFQSSAFDALAAAMQSFKARGKSLSWSERRAEAFKLASKLADLLGSEGEEEGV